MIAMLGAALAGCGVHDVHPTAGPAAFRLTRTVLTIPQVDYQPAIYYDENDPYPHLDRRRVDRARVVDRRHEAVILENEYLRLTLLPAMGRVYSMVYAPTGHDQLWHNDIVTVGGGQNDAGWWIWIGGIEYTLPGDEHGTTWALPWRWNVVEDGPDEKRVRMEVSEPGTGLEETLEIALEPERAYFTADIRIHNPTHETAQFAHWVNPMWAPGGRNELTDHTEFVIPTDRVRIEERWQDNLGASPQDWEGNPLRFIRGWRKAGDLMADGLRDGFYGAYSHDEQEGVVRVFDPAVTPGVDIWTYGYHPTRIPMGSSAPNRGYVEMWGGTSPTYPDERRPLLPSESIRWTEWMYPFHGTGGLTFADRDLAVAVRARPSERAIAIGLCPSGRWSGEVELWRAADLTGPVAARPLQRWTVDAAPDRPFRREVRLAPDVGVEPSELRVIIAPAQGEQRVIVPQA